MTAMLPILFVMAGSFITGLGGPPWLSLSCVGLGVVLLLRQTIFRGQ